MERAINIYTYPLSRSQAASAGGMTPAALNNNIARHDFLQMTRILKEGRKWDFEEVLIIGVAQTLISCGVEPSIACGYAMSNAIPHKWIVKEPAELDLPIFSHLVEDENPKLSIPLDPIAQRGAEFVADLISSAYGEGVAARSIELLWENREKSRKAHIDKQAAEYE